MLGGPETALSAPFRILGFAATTGTGQGGGGWRGAWWGTRFRGSRCPRLSLLAPPQVPLGFQAILPDTCVLQDSPVPSCSWASPSWSVPISLEARGPQHPLPVGTPALSLERLRVAHQADANADLHLGAEASALGPALGCSFSLTSPSDRAPKTHPRPLPTLQVCAPSPQPSPSDRHSGYSRSFNHREEEGGTDREGTTDIQGSHSSHPRTQRSSAKHKALPGCCGTPH